MLWSHCAEGVKKTNTHRIPEGHGEVGLCIVGMWPMSGQECVLDSAQGCGLEFPNLL